MVVSMLVVLPALCVGAFSGRGVYGACGSVASWFGGRTVEVGSTQAVRSCSTVPCVYGQQTVVSKAHEVATVVQTVVPTVWDHEL